MKYSKLFTIAFFTMALAIAISSCASQENKKNADTSEVAKAENVKTMRLELKRINRSVVYSSALTAFESVHLAPASPGRVEKIYVQVGDRVAKGDVVALMDQTQLHQAMVQLKNIEVDFKRLDTLQKVGGVARQQYDQIKTSYEIAKSNVDFLTENTRLRAPFGGIISGKYYENGEMYNGSPNAAGKAAVVSIVQINPLKLLVNVSEHYFPQIKKGMNVLVVSDIYTDKQFNGKVFRIHPTIDASTRTFTVEVEIPNSDALLRPGMFARADFELDQVEALLVPALAILKVQGSDERYLFKEVNGKAVRVGVKTGQRIDDEVEVISNNLSTGDNIIIFGQTRLLDGSDVKVVNE